MTRRHSAGLYIVRVCPECDGQFDGLTWTHTGDCSNRGKIHGIEEIETVAIDRLGFDGLMHVAQRLLDEHYPADVMAAMADDPGPKLTFALRECMEAIQR